MAQHSPILTCLFCFIFAFHLCGTDGADEAVAVKQSPTEVAQKLEEALKMAQDGLKGFYSEDTLVFTNSLLNTAGTLPPWIQALATAFGQIPPLIDPNPPSDPELKLLTTAMEKVSSNIAAIYAKYEKLEPEFPKQIIQGQFQKQLFALDDIVSFFGSYSRVPNTVTLRLLVSACTDKDTAQSLIRWIFREIDGGNPAIMNHFQHSCNYTEIIFRSRTVAGIYMMASQVVALCYGAQYSNPTSPRVSYDARELDENWAKLAAKFHSALMSIKQLTKCLPVFTDAVDFYSKKNKDLGHEQFATGLASHLFETFPWVNWYVFSYDDGLGGDDEHFCIEGILSHCIQGKYGRNLFVAGQQNEDNYFYNRNCPAKKDCVAKLDRYENCEAATKPFEQCIKEKCKPPAGILCKKSSDGFPAEKGKSASSDGWSKASFGGDRKHSMHMVSP